MVQHYIQKQEASHNKTLKQRDFDLISNI